MVQPPHGSVGLHEFVSASQRSQAPQLHVTIGGLHSKVGCGVQHCGEPFVQAHRDRKSVV